MIIKSSSMDDKVKLGVKERDVLLEDKDEEQKNWRIRESPGLGGCGAEVLQ